MKLIRFVSASLTAFAVTLGIGCRSVSPGAEELVKRARMLVDHQECEALMLVRALASAQRDAAKASWDLILNAAAQNFRFRTGAELDSFLSDEDRATVHGIARKNLAAILEHVSETEADLIEAIGFDYDRRSRLLENLVGSIDDDCVRREVLKALERLDDARRRADVDQVEHSFKKVVERQTGYVG